VAPGICLIAALVAPRLLIIDTGLTTVGAAFVALMFAASAAGGVACRWRWLLIAAAIAAAPQAVALFADRARPDGSLLALSAIFCLVYLAAGIGRQLRSNLAGLDA